MHLLIEFFQHHKVNTIVTPFLEGNTRLESLGTLPQTTEQITSRTDIQTKAAHLQGPHFNHRVTLLSHTGRTWATQEHFDSQLYSCENHLET